MSPLMWCRSFHKIIQRQCNSQTHIKTFVRLLPSYSARGRGMPEMDDDEPYYSLTEDDPPVDPSIITVPLRLQKRLTKKIERENTKYGQRLKNLYEARRGSRTEVVITARRPELNHRKGQTYGRFDEIPLVSKGWKHRQSKGDFFTIHALSEDPAFVPLEDRETFDKLGLKRDICKVLEDQKIEKPTVIQATAIPEILKGKNNLLAAETGCGKTLAYLLPLFEQIMDEKLRRHPRIANQPLAVVLVPTRELAEQVAIVSMKVGGPLGIRTKLVQGGTVRSKINNPSTKLYDILVSTISVTSALSVSDALDLSRMAHVVLDEADTLLDDSFSDDVIRFLGRFQFTPGPKCIQATLVSATMPRSVESILGEVIPMDSLNRITTPGLHRVVKAVPQKFLRVRKMDKPIIMLDLIAKATEKKAPMIIFGNKGETCHWLKEHLYRNGIDSVAVHGKILPGERKGLLRQYTEGEIDVLICTDIASRGIDTIRTKHVVNYEFPKFLADYVHRCGRVGRVGSALDGMVTNLISGAFEIDTVQEIETAVRKDESLQKVNANIKRILNARYGMYKPIQPIGPNDQEQ